MKYLESDLIVSALDRNGARVSFMAKGARKSKKRFGGGVLQPTHYVEFKYKSSSRPSDSGQVMYFLEEAVVINDFSPLRKDYDRLNLGLYFVHLIEKVSLEGVIDSEYSFDLLGNALTELENTPETTLLKTQFELKFLHSQGVLPPGIEGGDFLSRPISAHRELAEHYAQDDIQLMNIRSKVSSFLNQYLLS